jgi:hypothetical protein
MMSDVHPTPPQLEDFMLGRLSQRESRSVILHLLPGCSSCQAITADLWDAGRGAATGSAGNARNAGDIVPRRRSLLDYDEVVDRVFARVRRARTSLEAERAAARRRLAELEIRPAGRRRALVEGSRRFQTWGVCELLVARSLDEAEAGEAELWAGLAIAASARLDPAVYPQAQTSDLRARAWCALAEARRLAADFVAVQEALRTARGHLALGSGDRLERGALLECESGLRQSQGRLEEAARLLGRAILLYRRAGQADLVGRALIALGCVRLAAGEPGRAVPILRSGLELAGAAPGPLPPFPPFPPFPVFLRGVLGATLARLAGLDLLRRLRSRSRP